MVSASGNYSSAGRAIHRYTAAYTFQESQNFKSMSKSFLFFFLIALMRAPLLSGQSPEDLIAEGNAAYDRNAFEEAERYYKEAIAKDAARHWPQAIYNLGNALYQQKKFNEAKKQFEELGQAPVSGDLK